MLNKQTCTAFLCASLLTACVTEDDPNTNNGDPVIHQSEVITSNATWSGTHIVQGSLDINAELVIEPCTRVEIGSNVIIHVDDGGSIRAIGSEDCPVVFTSAISSPGAGAWQRFDIWSSASNNNRFEHVEFEYGGSDQYGVVWVEEGARAEFSEVSVSSSSELGFYFETGANISEFSGIHFRDIGGYPVRMDLDSAGNAQDITVEDVTRPHLLVAPSTTSGDVSLAPLSIPYEWQAQRMHHAVEVEAGTELRMAPNVVHHVENGGTLRMLGTAEAPIIVASAKSSPAAGDWERFDIWDSAGNDSLFQYTTLRHGGGGGVYGAIWVEDGGNLGLDEVLFEESEVCDVYPEAGATVDATATTYTDCTAN